jgi:hypothetical protein
MAATYEIIINRYKNEIKSLNGKLYQMKQQLEIDDDDSDKPLITVEMLKPHLGQFGIKPEILDNPMLAQLANEFIKKPSIQKQLASLAQSQIANSTPTGQQKPNMFEV